MATKSPKDLAAESAFPFAQATESFHTAHIYHRGVSKRELLIACALMGAAANDDFDATRIAQNAVDAADAALSLMVGGAA